MNLFLSDQSILGPRMTSVYVKIALVPARAGLPAELHTKSARFAPSLHAPLLAGRGLCAQSSSARATLFFLKVAIQRRGSTVEVKRNLSTMSETYLDVAK